MTDIVQNGNGLSPENAGAEGTVNNVCKTPYIEIIEQPASKALRFRYECEGRSAGSIPGVHNTPENKTYPTIRIVGYKGEALIVVSCVTKDEPYRAHPHNLVGKEGCKDGIYTTKIDNETMTATFSNLGIQCVKKKDIEEALRIREDKRVDPFRQGFAHSQHASSIDLNAVRLCFQAFLTVPGPKKFNVLTPVVSDPIYDKKAMSDLVITKLSHSSASVKGGQEVILLCEKVAKEDIQIRFYEEVNGMLTWEGYGEFTPSQVHKQVGIWFKTPSYRTTEVEQKVKVFIQLKRPSDGATSEPLPFLFIQDDSGYVPRKKHKLHDYPLLLGNPSPMESSLFRLSPQPVDPIFPVNHPQSFAPVKEEPRTTPDFVQYVNSPAARSPYDNQIPSPSNYNPQYQPITSYGQENSQLPPFTNLPNATEVKQNFAEQFHCVNNFSNGCGNSMPLGSFMDLFMNHSTGPPYDGQNRNENEISLELKVDSKDLVRDSYQMDAASLSENLTQSLTISATQETNNNMTDSLTRLANETVDKLQSLQQL